MRPTIAVTVLILAAACTFGPRVEHEPLAREPRGANVTLRTQTQSIQGELLEVRDTALLVLAGTRITLVPYAVIRQGEAEMVRQITSAGRPPPPERRERLRRISRFPQGLTPVVEQALLEAYDQSEPEVARE